MKLTSFCPGVFCFCCGCASCRILCGGINATFALKFDAEQSRGWIQTAGITLGLSLGVWAVALAVWSKAGVGGRGRQERTKSPQERPKTASRSPRTTQDRPRAAQEPPRAAQEPPQEPSWNGLGAIFGPINHKIEIQTAEGKSLENVGVDFCSQNGSQNDPKTTRKRVKNQNEKCITFLSLLDPSWTGLEAILGPILGSNGVQNLGKRESA